MRTLPAGFEVRPATPDDVSAMSHVHVASWQQTYRGQIPDRVLDAADFVPRREQYWSQLLALEAPTDEVAVATVAGEVVGLASAGSARDEDATWPTELYTLYVLRAHHGRGLGSALLGATVGRRAASLWVAERNTHAVAFYTGHGFVADGTSKDDGIIEIRMRR